MIHHLFELAGVELFPENLEHATGDRSSIERKLPGKLREDMLREVLLYDVPWSESLPDASPRNRRRARAEAIAHPA
jgi:hypothetical protein